MKQRYYTGFIKIRQKKCRQSQFGSVCQITPPLISLNSLSNAVLYKAKSGAVEGCLISILNFIQLLCTSTLIPSHQELLDQNGSSQVQCEHNTHTCALCQDGEVHQSFTTQCTEVLEIPFLQTEAQLNLSLNPKLSAIVENVHTDRVSQKSATAFYHFIQPVTTKTISNPY